MKAVHYERPFQVSVKKVPQPKIEHPDDAIVRVTTAGPDSSPKRPHLRLAVFFRFSFVYHNMGIVEQIGQGVTLLKKGDRVVMPFNVACGRCLNCEEGRTAFCTGVNPGFAGGAYGYVAMGPYAGFQPSVQPQSHAQYLRVPFADFNALILPPGTKHESSFALLADIFPTGWHGLTLSHFSPGESVAVFGAGPVGLMAAYSASLRGAARVFVIDRVPERLAAADKIPGCEGIDFGKVDAVEEILKRNGGMVDRSIDCVGYQASGKEGSEVPNVVMEQCIMVTRPTGGIGVPGLYVPSDPGAVDEDSKRGMMRLSFGKLFEKKISVAGDERKMGEKANQKLQGLTIGTGQCNVKKYNRYLRDMIISGQADPSFVVSHEIAIEEAPTAYEKFDKRIEGYTKVLIHPNGDLK
ncbi:MAG: hypothetical protein Q9191_005274 [Dirinaria sp. TL-2023a]